MQRVGLYMDERYRQHETGSHPERPARLRALSDALHERGLVERLVRLTPQPATDEDLGRVHGQGHLDMIAQVVQAGGGELDGDTMLSPKSDMVARLAAGAGITAAKAIRDGQIDRAFCAIRPPGHHALANRGMGFCLYNNAAVVAQWLRSQAGASRVLIVDFDVHHGNGTQTIFDADPDVWFLSMHQYPFYPGTGGRNERGVGAGLGATCNLPMPAHAPADACVEIWGDALTDFAEKCRPEWVLISAGFDAHHDDPLAQLELHENDFARLTMPIVEIAETYARGRIISLLEGGYDLRALGASAVCHIESLL